MKNNYRTVAQIKQVVDNCRDKFDSCQDAPFGIRAKVGKQLYPTLKRLVDELNVAMSHTNAVRQSYDRGKIPTAEQQAAAQVAYCEYGRLQMSAYNLMSRIEITLRDLMEDVR